MEHKKFRELVGYKIVPLNSEVSCQAPQDACEDCALCIYDYLHYEKIGPDGKCDSERHQEKMIQEQKRSLALQMKIRREKQLNRQMELNAELKKLKKELDNLISGGA